ncbi:MAG: guanylate kinase [Bacteroidales bacterium]|nr:guanylate kinase [Bacteroidales bacterium]
METKQGKVVIFSAPSGAGKTTIVKHLLSLNLGLEFSVSATTRIIRDEETHGKDYYFLSLEEFKRGIENRDFLEWQEVYKDHYYGTLKSEVDRIWQKGKHVIFDVDVVGGLNIKKIYGEKALAVFVQPPSPDMLEERLRNRSTESEDNLHKRIDKAAHELTFASRFDRVIINDDLQKALNEAEIMVSDFLKK